MRDQISSAKILCDSRVSHRDERFEGDLPVVFRTTYVVG